MTATPVRLLAVLILLGATPVAAQTERPVPYPVIENPKFSAAVENGTRTATGEPGPEYWMNGADYTINAVLSPDTRMLRATGTISYTNNSPDDLRTIVIHLRQNLHAEGVVRNRPQKLTEGMDVASVSLRGRPLVERSSLRDPGYVIDGTRLTLRPDEPVESGETVDIGFTWSFEVPEAGAPRIGTDGEIFFVGYWYPQVAVYDDVSGWKADPYMGNGEFYMGYGDYDVSITVPHGWLVGATGQLMNPEQVLSERTRERLAEAASTRDIVRVVTEDERGEGSATLRSDDRQLTWRFEAENVRDFAFGASDLYLWDATHAEVGDVDGNGTNDTSMIHAFYRPDAGSWARSAEFGRYSIEFLSEQMAMPYPWPHMTTVEGVIGGGMEFPMITHIGGARSDRSLFGVTFHEIGHMWFPMIVGQDEKQFTWMDEGLTSFNTSEATVDFWDADAWAPDAQSYYFIAGTGDEVESMRHGDRYPLDTPARGIASYNKPAVAMNALRGIVGNERFYEAYREYARRWMYKHPQPDDLFNTFNDVLGENLDWFWTTMFFETWTLDVAVGDVTSSEDGVTVTVEDRGLSPFPIPVRVTYADGTEAEKRIPVDVWLGGAREADVTFEAGDVTSVQLDPDRFLPDVDRTNNSWSR